ncbi:MULTISPECIES: hypothetical protein [unclassified Streptomyces]|uniref:hypothetical protein n=1 Tax=unclassified Streptomyces TaxID=2593676 RepID=UPI0036F173B6
MPSQSAATLRSRYVEQAASDLEKNRLLQQELAEKLKMLKQEEALLADILALAERYEGSLDAPPLPEQLQQEPLLTGGVAPAEESRHSRTHAKDVRPGRTGGRAGARGKSRQPLLSDVLAELLGAHTEPRLAKELRDELVEKHPDREPTPQVVRNTLESLVAKGRIRRHKQKRSVMYSLIEPSSRRSTAHRSDEEG